MLLSGLRAGALRVAARITFFLQVIVTMSAPITCLTVTGSSSGVPLRGE